MSRFTKIIADKDIKVNNKTVVRKGTKGLILNIKEESKMYVRFSTGRMLDVHMNVLAAL